MQNNRRNRGQLFQRMKAQSMGSMLNIRYKVALLPVRQVHYQSIDKRFGNIVNLASKLARNVPGIAIG